MRNNIQLNSFSICQISAHLVENIGLTIIKKQKYNKSLNKTVHVLTNVVISITLNPFKSEVSRPKNKRQNSSNKKIHALKNLTIQTINILGCEMYYHSTQQIIYICAHKLKHKGNYTHTL